MEERGRVKEILVYNEKEDGNIKEAYGGRERREEWRTTGNSKE